MFRPEWYVLAFCATLRFGDQTNAYYPNDPNFVIDDIPPLWTQR